MIIAHMEERHACRLQMFLLKKEILHYVVPASLSVNTAL